MYFIIRLNTPSFTWFSYAAQYATNDPLQTCHKRDEKVLDIDPDFW